MSASEQAEWLREALERQQREAETGVRRLPLSRRQLDTIERNLGEGHDCAAFVPILLAEVRDLNGRLAAQEAQAGAVMALLSRLEWKGADFSAEISACPACGAWECGAHESDCALCLALTPSAGTHTARILAAVEEWRAAERELRAAVAAREAYWGDGGKWRLINMAVYDCRVRVERAREALLAADDAP